MSYPHPYSLPSRTLIAVRDLHEQFVAGLGSASMHVRTLDRVSLDVRAGELLLVSGAVASGARSLLLALSGVRGAWHGTRWVASGVRVRRASIGAASRDAIAAAWRDCAARSPRGLPPARRHGPNESPRVVYLLQVRAYASVECNRGLPEVAWREWVDLVHAAGGAVVIASHQRRDLGIATLPSISVRERSTHDPGDPPDTGQVREIALVAGRIVPSRFPARAGASTRVPGPEGTAAGPGG